MEIEYPYHTTFLLLLMTIVAIRMYFSGYADAASGVSQTTEGEGAFRVLRVVLGIPATAAFLAYAIWPPSMAWSHLDLASETRWLGLVPFVGGIAFLVWVHRHLSRNFTGTVQIRPGGAVIKTGPYAYVRHPMYWSFLLIGSGTLLLTANWFLGGVFLTVILVVMYIRLPLEEAALLKAYGEEYAQYARRTGKFFPKLSAFSR